VLTSGINALLLDLSVDGVLAAADGLVLIVHDRPSTRRSIITQITGESGDGRNDNNDSELATLFACTDTSIDDGPADGVVNRVLVFAGGSDCEG
jgi:hypothetical protein